MPILVKELTVVPLHIIPCYITGWGNIVRILQSNFIGRSNNTVMITVMYQFKCTITRQKLTLVMELCKHLL